MSGQSEHLDHLLIGLTGLFLENLSMETYFKALVVARVSSFVARNI